MCSSKRLIPLALIATYLSFAESLELVPQVVAFEGDSAELSCNYDGSVYSVRWKKGDDIDTTTVVASFQGGNYEGSDGGRVMITSSWSLMISGVRSGDQGKYFCEVTPTNSGVISNEIDLVIAVPPQEPFPTLAVVFPDPPPPGNASCDYIVTQGSSVQMTCSVANFYPSVRLDWFKDDVSVAGTQLNQENSTGGLLDAYGGLTFTVGEADIDIRCEASGEAVQGEPHTASAVICSTGSDEEESGGSNTTTIIVIVIIVILLVTALVGLIWWMRRLIKDSMIRSNYSKSVSADDDTPAKSRMSNYCHFMYVTVCPCMNREELYDVETGGKSRPKEVTEKKPTAPSAALKARLQQNRKKQDNQNANGDPVASDLQHEESPMLDDTRQATAPTISAEVHTNERPPGARPKARPNDYVIIRDPSQPPSEPQRDEVPGQGEEETGF